MTVDFPTELFLSVCAGRLLGGRWESFTVADEGLLLFFVAIEFSETRGCFGFTGAMWARVRGQNF